MKSKNMTLQKVKMFFSNRLVAVTALLSVACVLVSSASADLRTVIATEMGAQEETTVTTNVHEWEFTVDETEVQEEYDVTIEVDGVLRMIVMTEGTVADALLKADVEIGEDDILSVPAETVIKESTVVKVDRVTFVERVETEEVAYGSSSYETSDYEKGKSVVVTYGQNGEKELTYRDRLVNGEVVETELVDETITKQPVDQVTAIGTYVAPAVSKPSAGGGSTAEFTYSKVYYGQGTAYTNENGLCGKYTASGMLAQVGVVAVNPKIIPYGTRLYVTTADGSYTYGYCVAGDTGGFIYSHPDTIVDLFFNTVAECYEFGRRDVIVYVLD